MGSFLAICMLLDQYQIQICHRRKTSSFLQDTNYVAKITGWGQSWLSTMVLGWVSSWKTIRTFKLKRIWYFHIEFTYLHNKTINIIKKEVTLWHVFYSHIMWKYYLSWGLYATPKREVEQGMEWWLKCNIQWKYN